MLGDNRLHSDAEDIAPLFNFSYNSEPRSLQWLKISFKIQRAFIMKDTLNDTFAGLL